MGQTREKLRFPKKPKTLENNVFSRVFGLVAGEGLLYHGGLCCLTPANIVNEGDRVGRGGLRQRRVTSHVFGNSLAAALSNASLPACSRTLKLMWEDSELTKK